MHNLHIRMYTPVYIAVYITHNYFNGVHMLLYHHSTSMCCLYCLIVVFITAVHQSTTIII